TEERRNGDERRKQWSSPFVSVAPFLCVIPLPPYAPYAPYAPCTIALLWTTSPACRLQTARSAPARRQPAASTCPFTTPVGCTIPKPPIGTATNSTARAIAASLFPSSLAPVK